jgi:hypothetical protein
MSVTETVKQLIIINVLFIGTLIVGDPAYKMLAMFFLRMTAFNYGNYFACLTVGIYLFNMFALYSFGSALRVFGKKKFYSSIFCGLGAALMHTGINYYYFNDVNTLAANGFLRRSSSALNQNKHNGRSY